MDYDPKDPESVIRFLESLQGPLDAIAASLARHDILLDQLQECTPLSEAQCDKLSDLSRMLSDLRATMDQLKLKLDSLDIPASPPDAP